MNARESALCFDCGDARLYAVLHRPEHQQKRGVVIVVGGPQYRVGSHRQFVLLARALAAAGIPVLRFDYRGMGDSEGVQRSFESVDDDIKAAIDILVRETGVDDVVLWGLCDAASAAIFYGHTDPRVSSLVLLNPWVRSEQLLAGTYLRHYYLSRFFSRDLWRRVFAGEVSVRNSLAGFFRVVRSAFGISQATDATVAEEQSQTPAQKPTDTQPLAQRMARDLQRFNGRTLFIISGQDMTAAEFETAAKQSQDWQRLLKRSGVETLRLDDADHTFSRSVHRLQVEARTLQWVAAT